MPRGCDGWNRAKDPRLARRPLLGPLRLRRIVTVNSSSRQLPLLYISFADANTGSHLPGANITHVAETETFMRFAADENVPFGARTTCAANFTNYDDLARESEMGNYKLSRFESVASLKYSFADRFRRKFAICANK